MADGDENVRMPTDNWDYVADYSDNNDDINENMDDLGEDESDEEESDNDDDEEDESDDGIESDDEEYNTRVEMKKMETFVRTFHNGDYDIEFDEALTFDRGLIEILPSMMPPQASYNKPDNWRERNRIGLDRVKRQLQECIANVRKSKLDLFLTHNIYGHQLIDNEEPIVWHETILDEYWGELEAEINRKRQQEIIVTDIKRIIIQNVEMKKERLAALVATLSNGVANSSSTYIQFKNANLCGEGIVWLSKLVEASLMLNTLTINHNRIDNLHSACCLSRSLKSHPCIDRLYLTHCDLGSSPEMLSVILQSEVKCINLDNNNIDSLGAVTISEYLESDPSIEHLFLGHNQLNDDDAVLMSLALKKNKNLRQIEFCSNNFTSIGVKALLTCVFDASSLNAISESNHILVGMNFFDDKNPLSHELQRLQCCIDRLLQLDRTQKICLALQDKDSLLQYLVNVPAELIPEVLALSQRGNNQRQHRNLNILYSAMRWWNMPMLYSYDMFVKSDTKRRRSN
jgi:hypothetical protein